MLTQLPDFTPLQWKFLSTMAAFDVPVSLDVIGRIVKLPHGQFLELMLKCQALNWIYQDENGSYGLSNNLPDNVQSKIAKINTSDKLTKLLDSLKSNNLCDQIPEAAMNRILHKIELNKVDLKNEIALAIEALRKGERIVAKKHVRQIDLLLATLDETSPESSWFISEAVKLSEYCVVRSVGLSATVRILEKIISIAQKVGDQRSWTMANMLLGRNYWLQSKPHEAILYLGRGKEKAEELGDQDILTYANVYIGLYYFALGYLNKAAGYLKPFVTQFAWTDEEYVLGYEIPILLSYCDINRGDFHRAIGTIDFFRQFAIKRQDYYTASLYRAVLGIILWVLGKRKEAIFHMEGSQTDALAVDNFVAHWTSLHGLASLYFNEGDSEKGLPIFHKILQMTEKAGVVHYIFHPIFLESYFNAEQAGCDLPPGWHFDSLFEEIMSYPNVDLKGVALRLRAIKSISLGKDEVSILTDLEQSESLLAQCEDLFQLAKTKIEKVRFYLRNHDYERARSLAYDVYKELTGYSEIFFPDDLQFLLEGTKIDKTSSMDYSTSLEPILRILEELFSGPDAMNLDLLLSTLSRFFRAERSGIFFFHDGKAEAPELKTARNLSRSIISDQSFHASMALIKDSYLEQKPVLSKLKENTEGLIYQGSLSVMTIPLLKGSGVKAVLYFDNSYMSDCFDFISMPMLELLGRHLAGVMEKQESDFIKPAVQEVLQQPWQGVVVDAPTDYFGTDVIIKDQKMIKLLNQAKRLAASEAPILILGETGSGKEVVAQWIHNNSSRHNKPFVIVDLTTIPDNLMESELFGHEKGAFTGAVQQKIGRVELAEGGTLFFDEIGEIPIQLQVKLLRLLEQKTLTRVGGTKTKRADFRLVAATNRNLFEEVKAGLFREDLYYRLNALELTIPPLRERKMDIVALSHHFLFYYAKKYNKKLSALSKEQITMTKNYDWPGNVRELKNVIERAVLVADEDRVELDFSNRAPCSAEHPFADFPAMDEIQRRYIQYVLDHNGGKVGGEGGAAEILKMNRSTLKARMKNLGMRKV